MSLRPTRFVTRGTSRVAYDPGDSSSNAPSVILLHELLSDRFAYAQVVTHLEPEFRVIAVDLRGHGASASLANRQYGMDDLVADLESVIEREELTSVHLIGHGLGSAIALATAVIRPELVQSLTLVDPDLGKTANVSENAESRAKAADASYKELHDRALIHYLGQSWQTECGADRARVVRRNAPALAALLTTLGICSFAESQVAALPMPINLIVSADAAYSVATQARFIMDSAPDLVSRAIGSISGPAAIFEGDRANTISTAIRDRSTRI
ncbi:MAG: alpha/beta fold hydrolase [Thermomicrobiales bacterium]